MTDIEFEIRVRGLVDARSLDDVEDVSVTPAAASTVLRGTATDQAALLGLISRLQAHGLAITEVRRLLGAPGE